MTLALLLLLPALAAASFFRSAEAAIFCVPDSRVRVLAADDTRGGARLLELRREPDRLLVLLRLLALVSEATALVAASYLGAVWGGAGGAVAGAGVIVLLLLVLGTAVPTRVLLRDPVSAARRSSLVLSPLSKLLRPLVLLLERLPPALPHRGTLPIGTISEQQIRRVAGLAHHEPIEEHERQLIERAVRMDETKAWDIMTPRVDVFAWQDNLPVSAVAAQLSTVSFSRVPIYGESIDDVTGVLHVRDAYEALVTGQRDVPLRALARQPLIVPGSVSLTTLLRDFQARRIHLAIVVDEYGGTDGLVTLEDVIEELVGEIVDETDVAEEPIVRVSRHEIIAAGDADLRELNHFFRTAFPLLEHRSLNGWLLEELGRVPQSGERLEREGLEIEVLEATETQVVRVRLRRPQAAETAAQPETERAAGGSAR